jgi:glycine cleavage system H protein
MSTYYTKEHEWITVEGEQAFVGISTYAVKHLGDVVFVETPEVGASFSMGDEMGVVESVKAASDVYMPVSGEVIEVNAALDDAPETVNASPEKDGWFCKIKLSNLSELDGLMNAESYASFCEGD